MILFDTNREKHVREAHIFSLFFSIRINLYQQVSISIILSQFVSGTFSRISFRGPPVRGTRLSVNDCVQSDVFNNNTETLFVARPLTDEWTRKHIIGDFTVQSRPIPVRDIIQHTLKLPALRILR